MGRTSIKVTLSGPGIQIDKKVSPEVAQAILAILLAPRVRAQTAAARLDALDDA